MHNIHHSPQTKRETVTTIWQAGVDAVLGDKAVKKVLKQYNIPIPDGIIAIGKASTSMFKGAHQYYCEQSSDQPSYAATIVTKYHHCEDELRSIPNVTIFETGHPIPDQASLDAGKAVFQIVSEMEDDSNLLILVSGGASALIEMLHDDMSLQDLKNFTDGLMRTGADIETMNRQRIMRSRVKGGKLLEAFPGKTINAIGISDVPEGNFGILGSGIGSGKRINPEKTNYQQYLAATNQIARAAAEKKATELGLPIIENSEPMYEDVNIVAKDLSQRLLDGPKGLYIWGGEPTVILPENPGSGGRNQALGLLMAKHLAGEENITLIVAGTDGTDGPTEAAGAIVDGETYHKTEGADEALKKADAGTYLKNCGDLFVSGPTGTNVMDIMIALKE